MGGDVRAGGGEVRGEGVERSVGLMVRLTPAEREGWHAAARAAGWGKTASWVREVVAQRVGESSRASSAGGPVGAGSGGSSRVVGEQLARVRAELVRIGVNVNQIAFQVNAGVVSGRVTELGEVRRELAAVRSELGALRTAVQALVDAAGSSAGAGGGVPGGAMSEASVPDPSPAGVAAWDRRQQARDAAQVAAARAEVARLEALRAQIAARSPLRSREDMRGGGGR